jgi:hypothetical protein
VRIRFDFYERIARLLVESPEISLADLCLKHGFTAYAAKRAQRMFGLKLKKGKASPAYPRN